MKAITVRFSDELADAIKELAWQRRTSINVLIVTLAQQATKSTDEPVKSRRNPLAAS